MNTSWNKRDYGTLALSYIPAAVVTWAVHEFAHWLTGVSLGYEMWISLNQAGPVHGSYESDSHRILVAMAGPVVTWFQAIVALFAIRRFRRPWLYSFLFLTVWMRCVALVISYIAKPNDEAVASLLLGLPIWAAPAISVLLLLALTYRGSRILSVGWRGNLLSYLLASIVTTLIVYADQLLF